MNRGTVALCILFGVWCFLYAYPGTSEGLTANDTQAAALDEGSPRKTALPDLLQVLERNKPQVVSFITGYSREPFTAVENAIRSASPEQYKDIEAWLLACIQTDGATPDCKRFVCRMLQRVGTVRSAAVLTPLLLDQHLSHMAIYALEHIPDSVVDATLQAAAAKAAGNVKAGIINSLGERRKAENIEWLAALVDDPDTAVSLAAVVALGKMSDDKAVEALARARQSANPALCEAATRAYLDCASRMLGAGRGEEAVRLFDEIFTADAPGAAHVAAFRGRVLARGEGGVGLVVEALKGDDPALEAEALQLVRELPGSAASQQFALLLHTLTGKRKALLLCALADRRDKTVLPEVLASLNDEDESVWFAAYDAIAALGDARAAIALVGTIAAGGQDARTEAARNALARISGKAVDEALIGALDTPDAALRKELIRTLVARKNSGAAGALIALARKADAPARSETFEALGILAQDADLPALLDLMSTATVDSDREAAMSALVSAANRARDGALCASILVAALSKARATSDRCAIVSALGSSGTAAALEAVGQAARDENPAVQDAAVRTLAAWPSAEAVPALLELARGAARESHRILALRGYMRLLGEVKDWPVDRVLEGYKTALSLARRPEEKKQALGGLATVPAPEALLVVDPFVDNPELAKEAVIAVLKIAETIAAARPDQAKAALERIAAVSKDEEIQKAIAALLARLNAR